MRGRERGEVSEREPGKTFCVQKSFIRALVQVFGEELGDEVRCSV